MLEEVKIILIMKSCEHISAKPDRTYPEVCSMAKEITKRTTTNVVHIVSKNFEAVTSVLSVLQTWQVAAVLFYEAGRLNLDEEFARITQPEMSKSGNVRPDHLNLKCPTRGQCGSGG